MRRLFNVLLVLLAAALLTGTVHAESTSVSSMRTECVVESDGACTVTLRFTVNFASEAESFAIPISPRAQDISLTGGSYTVANQADYKLLRLSGVYAGLTELTLSYRLAETVTDDGERQRFVIDLLYPAWSCPIADYQVTVRLHQSFDSMPVFLSGYYGDLIDNYMEITIDEGTIHAVLNPKQTLQDHEAMSMSLELPEGFFDLRFLAGKTAPVDRLLFLGLLVLTALWWLIFLRNLPILPKRQAMPPEGGNAGEIPFVLTARSPDLALMVVQWASLGYLRIHRTGKGRLFLTREIDMDTERKRFEVEIFRTLFARGNRCDLRSGEFLRARQAAREKTCRYWQGRVFGPKTGHALTLRLLALGAGLALCLACFDVWVASKSWRWLAIVPLTLLGGAACWAVQQLGGFLLRRHSLRTAGLALLGAAFLLIVGRRGGFRSLMPVNLALQLVVGLLLRCGGRRTRSGAALAAELLGYRRYLLSSSQVLKSNLEADPQYFYRVLPFADALQVGRLFAGGFEQTRLEDCDWLDWEGKPLKTAPAFYARYCRLMAGLRGERDPGGQTAVSTRGEAAVKRRSRPAGSRTPVRTRPSAPERRPRR